MATDSTATAAEVAAPSPGTTGAVAYSFYREIQLYGLAVALLAIVVAFDVLSGGLYLSVINMANLGRQVAILGVAAAGVTTVIIMGEFDLSIGGATALISSIVGILTIVDNAPGWLAFAVGMAAAATVGLLQGYLISRLARSGFRVASFIVTLAGMLAYPAVALLILPQAAAPLPGWFAQVGTANVAPSVSVLLVVATAAAAVALLALQLVHGQRRLRSVLPAVVFVVLLTPFMLHLGAHVGIPVLLLICLTWVLVMEVITQQTVFGRHLYAIGGSRQNARLLGIDVVRTTMLGFLVMGLTYFLCGTLTLARLDAASPLIGQGLELQAIAAAAIGGVSLVGGRGRPYNALLGAAIIVGLTNGLNLLNVPALFQNITTAIVLVAAVWFDVTIRNRANQIVHV